MLYLQLHRGHFTVFYEDPAGEFSEAFDVEGFVYPGDCQGVG